MARPNFFIVGQPKAGTTAFFEFLRPHPEIFLPKRKETHFFCKDFHEESRRHHGCLAYFQVHEEEAYLSLFRDWRGEPCVGEASVHYLYSKVAAAEIHRFEPNARIIAFFRNPVDFLFSWHAYAMIGDGEHIEDFEEALAAESERQKGVGLTRFMKVPSKLFYSERVKYAAQLRRYIDLFGEDRVHVVIYEEFQRDPLCEFRKVLMFLGVDPDFQPQLRIFNPHMRLRFGTIARATKLPWAKQALRLMFPRRLRDALGLPALYRRLFLVEERRAQLSDSIRLRIMRQTIAEVQALSELLHRDLAGLWGYGAIQDEGGRN